MNSIYADKLKSKGLKATKERLEMLKLFIENSNMHFCINDIEVKCSNIGIATIYRNIKNFKDVGIINKISSNEGENFYQFCNGSNPNRTYLICVDCGRIIDYNSDDLVHMAEKVKLKYNFDVTDIYCNIYGSCSKCTESHNLKIVNGGI